MHPVEVIFRNHAYRFLHLHRDHIARAQEKAGFYETDLLLALEAQLKRRPAGELVIDGGAHVGNHSVFFAAVCQRPVWAFEPQPKVFECLVQNTQGLPVRCFETALGDGRTGRLRSLSTPDNTGHVAFDPGTGPITSTSLDALIAPDAPDALKLPSKVACIKLDIEDCEELALQHGQKLLARDTPILAIEDKEVLTQGRNVRIQYWKRKLPQYTFAGMYAKTPTFVLVS